MESCRGAAGDSFKTTAVGLPVCADGVVVRNQASQTLSNVVVEVNGLQSDQVSIPLLLPNDAAEIGSTLVITQVVVVMNGGNRMVWRAEVDGMDPRSIEQRKKTMKEAGAGK